MQPFLGGTAAPWNLPAGYTHSENGLAAMCQCGRPQTLPVTGFAMCGNKSHWLVPGRGPNLAVLRHELLLCPMEQHAKIFPADSQLGAHFIFISLLKKHRAQYVAVLGRKLGQHLLDLLSGFLCQQHSVRRRGLIGGIGWHIVERPGP